MHTDDMSSLPEPIRSIMAAQRRIVRATHRPYAAEWIHLDLSMGQLKTLMTLASRQPATVSEIAETLEVGKPAASTLVDRLVQLGYAQRTEDSEDRRRTQVSTTAAGSDLVARLRQGTGDRMVRWLDAMAPDELAALERGLAALAEIADHDTATESDAGLTADTAAAS